MGSRRLRVWCFGARRPIFWSALWVGSALSLVLATVSCEGQTPGNVGDAGPAAKVDVSAQAGTSTSTSSSSSVTAQEPGILAGTITDESGAVVVGAKVTLSGVVPERSAVTDGSGRFALRGAAAGTFRLTVTASGWSTREVTGTLQPGETVEVPETKLEAEADTDVEVVLAPSEVAQIEVKEEERQRIAGVYPNFFVTYNWHAAPLSAKQKWELSWKTTIDPVNFAFVGALAGLAQAQDDLSGYGQGAQGYAKRYGAEYADFAIGTALGGAVFPILLHQDPRFFYKSTGSVMSRALYALSTAVITRGDNGKWQPNYSSVLGDLAAGGASNLYYPKTDRNGWSQTITNGLINAAFDGVGNLVQEFILNRMTPGIPKSAKP